MCNFVWPGVLGKKCAEYRGKHSLRHTPAYAYPSPGYLADHAKVSL